MGPDIYGKVASGDAVAVKVPNPRNDKAVALGKDPTQRILISDKEGAMLATLSHQNIVKILGMCDKTLEVRTRVAPRPLCVRVCVCVRVWVCVLVCVCRAEGRGRAAVSPHERKRGPRAWAARSRRTTRVGACARPRPPADARLRMDADGVDGGPAPRAPLRRSTASRCGGGVW